MVGPRASTRFRYAPHLRNGQKRRRNTSNSPPGSKHRRFPARLDTGAALCVFERGYAETLGLAVETGTPLRFSTAIGSFDAYGHMVTLETLGYSFDVTVYFAAEESFTRNVLGRRGWLDRVRLGNRRV